MTADTGTPALGSPLARAPVWRTHVLIAAVILLYAGLFVLNGLSWRWDFQSNAGFRLSPPPDGLAIHATVPGGAAERAGLRAGDRLHRVNGRAVRTPVDYRLAEQSLSGDQPVLMELERDGRRLRVAVVNSVTVPWVSLAITTAIVLLYLGIGSFSVWRRRSDPRVRVFFRVTVLAPLTVLIPDYCLGEGEALSVVLTLALALARGGLIGSEIHLASVIPEPKTIVRRHAWLLPVVYLIGILSAVAAQLPYLAQLTGATVSPPVALALVRQFQVVYLGFGPAGVLAALAHTHLTLPAGASRRQTRVVLAGVIPWAFSLFFALGSWLMVGRVTEFVIWFNLIAIVPVPVAFALAIFRHRLFDVEVVIRKSIIYAVLTGVIFLIYYGALGLGGSLATLLFHPIHPVWLMVPATLLLALVFNPLRERIQRWVDRLLYPERFELRRDLPRLSARVAGQTQLETLIPAIQEGLERLLRMRSGAFLLANAPGTTYTIWSTFGAIQGRGLEQQVMFAADETVIRILAQARRLLHLNQLQGAAGTAGHRWLLRLEPQLLLPFSLQDKLVAVLTLGGGEPDNRLDGEERDLLDIFARQAAAMIENARLFRSATFDELTGLLRRGPFMDALSREMDRVRRFRRPLVVGMLDVDHFKRINDTFGHAAGDLVLKNIAHSLQSGIRSVDSLGRYGGEEMAFFLPETSAEDGWALADRLRAAIAELEVNTAPDDPPVRVQVSIGLSSWDGRPAELTPDVLIQQADQALYQAKSRGRNRVERWTTA